MIELLWPSMGMDEWAAYEMRVNRTPLVRVDGVWWRRVRSLFFRPLNVHVAYPVGTRGPRLGMALGAVQFSVEQSDSARSFIRMIVGHAPQAYSASALPSNVQRDIRKGCRNHQIRWIQTADAMVEHGFHVYREFQQRTHYQHLIERLDQNGFADWVKRVFEFRDIRVLGAYHEDSLSAVAITFRVGETLHYSSYFGNAFSLGSCASDCMLHTVRTAAAAPDSGVSRVHSAGAGMPRGLDNFYLRRGFKYFDQPALIRGNPLTLVVLRLMAPRAYRKLFGDNEDPGETAAERVGAPITPKVELK